MLILSMFFERLRSKQSDSIVCIFEVLRHNFAVGRCCVKPRMSIGHTLVMTSITWYRTLKITPCQLQGQQ